MTIRVLQIVNNMHRAGLETMLMNYYRHIDKEKIQFDFLTHRIGNYAYDDEIRKLGGKIYPAPRLYPQNSISYFKFMKKFFESHPEYKIVHSHIDSMSYLPLLAAKKAKIPIRIAHSHNTSIDFDYKFLLKELFRYKIIDVANYFCACGEDAGTYLFRNKREFKYIPNAIEKRNFLFNEEHRKRIRKEFGLENKFVIGNIGRLEKQKNQQFLLDIFYKFNKINSNSVLIIIGNGSQKEKILSKIKKLRLDNSVILLENRSDVNKIYQAMDVFLMPSLYEGIPVVGIEAQYSGLPCLFSEGVPREVKFSRDAQFLSISSPNKWVERLILLSNRVKKENRKNVIFLNNDFDINFSYILLQNYYLSLFDKLKEKYVD